MAGFLIGQPLHRTQRPGQGFDVVVGELAEHRGQRGPARGERLAVLDEAARCDLDEDGAQIGRVAGPLHQAELLEPADRHRRGRGADALVGRQIGHPDRALFQQGQQDRQLGQGQVACGAAVGVAAPQDGEQLGEDALQLSCQLVDLRFGLHHSSLV